MSGAGLEAEKIYLKSSLVALAAFFHKESASLFNFNNLELVELCFNDWFPPQITNDFELTLE